VSGVGSVAIVSATEVSLTPNTAKWKASRSPYFVRWVISDGGGCFKVPSGEADLWHVNKP
jgi:hypothetical protein